MHPLFGAAPQACAGHKAGAKFANLSGFRTRAWCRVPSSPPDPQTIGLANVSGDGRQAGPNLGMFLVFAPGLGAESPGPPWGPRAMELANVSGSGHKAFRKFANVSGFRTRAWRRVPGPPPRVPGQWSWRMFLVLGTRPSASLRMFRVFAPGLGAESLAPP